MAGYTTIANVSESLVTLLRDRIRDREGIIDLDQTAVALVSPDDVGSGSDIRIGLFLYDISQHGHAKNTGQQRIDDNTVRQPPIQLELSYLLTAYPSQSRGDDTAAAQEQQAVLGLAMQILDANSTLQADDLKGALTEDDQIHLTLDPQPTEEILTLWQTFTQAAFHPSVTYRVTPVQIESVDTETVTPVGETEVDVTEYGRPSDAGEHPESGTE